MQFGAWRAVNRLNVRTSIGHTGSHGPLMWRSQSVVQWTSYLLLKKSLPRAASAALGVYTRHSSFSSFLYFTTLF